MPITKFQALVARESMADVFPNYGTCEGEAGTVIGLMQLGDKFSVQVEMKGTAVAWYSGGGLDPSRHLLALIENGTYNEETMTWTIRMGDGHIITQPLYYGDNPNYQGKMNGEQYC